MSAIDKAAEILLNGGVALIPTDTVYGLSACYANVQAVKKIFEIKQRSLDKALPVLISSIDLVWNWTEKDEFLQERCEKYWPGPYTLIVDDRIGGSIALRIPDSEITLELLKLTGPLAATSANLSGIEAPHTIEQVAEEIKVSCDYILETSVLMSGVASAIIDIRGNDEKILRA